MSGESSITWFSENRLRVLPANLPIQVVVDKDNLLKSIDFPANHFPVGSLVEVFFADGKETSSEEQPVSLIDEETRLAFTITYY